MDIKFSWHANTNSGGNLSLSLDFINQSEPLNKPDKNNILAEVIAQAYKHMKQRGYIKYDAKLLSSRDMALEYGKSRQYWEKLLNEGKIPYKETSAGRITTELWVNGYLGNKNKVNMYVRNLKKGLNSIKTANKIQGVIQCPVCEENNLEFYVNRNGNTSGLCRHCNFHVFAQL